MGHSIKELAHLMAMDSNLVKFQIKLVDILMGSIQRFKYGTQPVSEELDTIEGQVREIQGDSRELNARQRLGFRALDTLNTEQRTEFWETYNEVNRREPERLYEESEDSEELEESETEVQSPDYPNSPDWYNRALEEGREGSQWNVALDTPQRPTRNDEPPRQKSKYQRAKERGYYRCVVEDCNLHRASHSRYCRRHGGEDQRCIVPECTTRARHGKLCKRHAGPEFKPQCESHGCNNIAQSRGLCHSHNPSIGKCRRCRIVRPKYSARLCSRCGGPRITAAETLLRPLITTEYPDARLNRSLVHHLRPDVTLFTEWGGILCIEIDEVCHTLYTAEREVEREVKIAAALSKPVIFLRLNPDSIKDKFGHTIRLGLRQRFAALMEEVNELMVRRPRGVRKGKPFTILLYYSHQREQEIIRARRAFNV